MAQTSIRINEFMALNQTILTDEDGNTSDWIEIFNDSSDPVNMQGWSLSTDSSDLQLWSFPDVTLNGNSYITVFASSQNRVDPGGELHTNFRLDGDGEYLALSNSEGEIVNQFYPEYPQQFPDISYGYHNGNYTYFTIPTPGDANQFSEHRLLSPPEFSVGHGFFESPFDVALTTDLPGATIYYTLDASEPSETNGEEYTAPVHITTTTVLRAVVIDADGSSSLSATQTYLFLDDVINQPNDPPGYPAEWGPYTSLGNENSIADYEMDPEVTQDPDYKNLMKESLLSIPAVSIVSDIGNFFSHDEDEETGGIYIYTGPPIVYNENTQIFGLGDGWERAGSVEFFNADGTEGFQANCGIRLMGGHSRRPEKSPKHSFRLVFRSEYGPTELDYPLFGEEGASSFNTFALRGGFCNKWFHWASDQRERSQYIRDRWAKDTQLAMGHLSGRGFFAHLYINGLYWGLYNPTERLDDDFAASYMGGDDSDYDVIKDYTEVVDGNIDAWNAMMGIARSGMRNSENYQRIQGNNPDGTRNIAYEPYLDMVNFIDYMILNFYGGNTDWDTHNWAAIRNRVNPDKGFKFFSWDGEHVLKDVYQNVLYMNNYNCPSELFQLLRENEDFRRLFADRVQFHCFNGGVLTPESASARYQERAEEIEMAIIAESARWGDYRRDVHPYSSGPFELYTKNDYWLPALSYLVDDYFPNRTQAFIEQLQDNDLFPQVSAPVFSINGNEEVNTRIESGDVLTMSTVAGTIYYTTNGSDPVKSQSSQSGSSTELFSQSVDKRVLVPKSNIGTDWRSSLNYDDSAWQLCSGEPGGVGYEQQNGYQSMISLDTANDMYNGGTSPNPSCYLRIKFNVSQDELSEFNSLDLGVLYDDGFIAYLNGIQVAEENAPGNPVWSSSSSSGHEAESFSTFDISANINNLVAGENLLAIHAMNQSTSSSDFIINASLQGSDEASSGGTVSPDAMVYSGPITLNGSAYIKARALSGANWSALTASLYEMSGDIQNLRVTEIHYHPLPSEPVDDREFEFIELKNTGNTSIDLQGVQFVNGISYTFDNSTILNPKEFVVLASNQIQFAARYDKEAFGEYGGNLDNGGERVVLVDAGGDTLFNVRYDDGEGWPTAADGEGYSLVPVNVNPEGDLTDPEAWRVSYFIHGSPGKDDTETAIEPDPSNLVATQFELMQNYPNPFNPVTRISYSIPQSGNVHLTIIDILGREIQTLVNEFQNPGHYSIRFNASELSSGVYFYQLKSADQRVLTRKMLLMR